MTLKPDLHKLITDGLNRDIERVTTEAKRYRAWSVESLSLAEHYQNLARKAEAKVEQYRDVQERINQITEDSQ